MRSSDDPFSSALKGVPSYEGFLTHEELEASSRALARDHRDLVKIVDIGYTRCGRKIRALIMGSGSRKALLFGAPHPNEPVGTLVLDYLSWRFAEDEDLRRSLDYTLIMVKAVDIDGLVLNEGWFKGRLCLRKYAENFYRPAGNVQVEWSFPIAYKRLSFEKPVPETRALMGLIEAHRPDFIYSLHNAGFGGVYYYISEEAPLLYPIYQLYPLSLGIPLSLGEPEAPWTVKLSDAVYKMVSTRDLYDFLEAQGADPLAVIKHGGSSYDYASAANPGVLELVAEVPYFYDPRIASLEEEDVSRRDAFLQGLRAREEAYRVVARVWREIRGWAADPCSEEGMLAESVEYFIETAPRSLEAQRSWALKSPELERKATRAEVFSSTYVAEFYSALVMGMLHRIIARRGLNRIPSLRPLVEEFEALFEERLARLESSKSYRALEISSLVKVQLAAGLYTMLYAQARSGR